MLTEPQRAALCSLLYRALLDIRTAGWRGDLERATALADACHNLPFFLYRDDFDWDMALLYLEAYYEKFPDSPSSGGQLLECLRNAKSAT